MTDLLEAFLLAFPALLTMLDPLNNAFVFRAMASGGTPAERALLARRVAIYSMVVMSLSLWAGTHILAFFGVTLGALRLAGGAVITFYGWQMQNAPDTGEAGASVGGPVGGNLLDIAVVPLTIPLTAGPGTISVAIALSSDHPPGTRDEMLFDFGTTLAAAAAAIVVYVVYRSADWIVQRMGPRVIRIVTRLIAFLVLCLGVQIMISGFDDVVRPLLAGRAAG
jgi:multiple antibiotic resistance protein